MEFWDTFEKRTSGFVHQVGSSRSRGSSRKKSHRCVCIHTLISLECVRLCWLRCVKTQISQWKRIFLFMFQYDDPITFSEGLHLLLSCFIAHFKLVFKRRTGLVFNCLFLFGCIRSWVAAWRSQLWCLGSSSCGSWAQLPHSMWDLCSPSRDRIHVPYIGRQILNRQGSLREAVF